MDEKSPVPDQEIEKDFSLIKAFLEGSDAAFDRLVLRYQDRVFRTCCRMLGDYHEANDSAQDVFVKVWRSLKKFRFQSSFSTWLFRISVNTCRNKLRSAGYRRRGKTLRLGSPGDEEISSPPVEIKSDQRTPGEELLRKETGKMIQDALDSLPPIQKTMVVLRDIEGFTYEEISAITGLKAGTVKSKLARARGKLRGRLTRQELTDVGCGPEFVAERIIEDGEVAEG